MVGVCNERKIFKTMVDKGLDKIMINTEEMNRLEYRVEIIYRFVKRLSKRLAILNTSLARRRCDERSYIKRLQRKHMSQSVMLNRFRVFSPDQILRLKKFLDKKGFQRTLKFIGSEGRMAKRNVVYLTRNQSAKLYRFLGRDNRYKIKVYK